MCKLQIINKVNSEIHSDQTIDCIALRRLSINNMPYFLTIEDNLDSIKYEFSFLDSPDKIEKNNNNLTWSYGETSGRLYFLQIFKSVDRVNSRMWSEIKKVIISESPLLSPVIEDLKAFLNALSHIQR